MRLALGLLLACVFVSPSRSAAAMAGRVLERVACQADSSQEYALYVPSGYSPDKKWPVIFCFDPGARGRVPVERLQAAAERYGYIVAGSLNSRNGPWADNAVAIQAMVRDVEAHLAIDLRRVYMAGLSGGARVATQIALSGLAKGVIACSAGFPSSEEGIPSRVPFVFFGTAGTEDFNYRELRRLEAELESNKATHRIVFFTGGHEWASVALLTEAVEWLELQAMRAQTKPRDDSMVASQWEMRWKALTEETGLARWRGLKSLAADFRGLRDVAAAETSAKELGATREIKDALKAERREQQREDDLMAELRDVANGGSPTQMKKLAGELRQKAGQAVDSAERQMARRVIAGFGSSSRDAARALLTSGDYREAAELLEVMVAFRPGQSRTLYDLARARAGAGDRRQALAALEQAAAAGFADVARVEGEGLFAKLRTEPAFKAVMQRIRGNPPEPEGRGERRR